MKFRAFAIAFAILACAAVSHAGPIQSANLADDGDGVITCALYNLVDVTPTGAAIKEYSLGIYGDHKRLEPGHILGPIVVPTEDDPKLTLLHDIDNDTTYTWTDYHAQITLNKTFLIDNVSVANTGWTYTVTQPTQVGSNWIGTVDYYSGTPVAPTQTLSFGYRLTFEGSVQFCEELVPTVPEPSTIALLACGLLGLCVARRRIAR